MLSRKWRNAGTIFYFAENGKSFLIILKGTSKHYEQHLLLYKQQFANQTRFIFLAYVLELLGSMECDTMRIGLNRELA
jgi:hypothetical protein